MRRKTARIVGKSFLKPVAACTSYGIASSMEFASSMSCSRVASVEETEMFW